MSIVMMSEIMNIVNLKDKVLADECTKQEWYFGDESNDRNLKGLPSVIFYRGDKPLIKIWIRDGKLHNDNGVAYVSKFLNGKIKTCRWLVHGKRHRDNCFPAIISFWDEDSSICGKGKIKIREIFMYKDDKQHNLYGPSKIEYDTNDKIIYSSYRVNGLRHREGGPACVYSSDNVLHIRYYNNGMLHREDGFAIVQKCALTGITIKEEYYVNNNNISISSLLKVSRSLTNYFNENKNIEHNNHNEFIGGLVKLIEHNESYYGNEVIYLSINLIKENNQCKEEFLRYLDKVESLCISEELVK